MKARDNATQAKIETLTAALLASEKREHRIMDMLHSIHAHVNGGLDSPSFMSRKSDDNKASGTPDLSSEPRTQQMVTPISQIHLKESPLRQSLVWPAAQQQQQGGSVTYFNPPAPPSLVSQVCGSTFVFFIFVSYSQDYLSGCEGLCKCVCWRRGSLNECAGDQHR